MASPVTMAFLLTMAFPVTRESATLELDLTQQLAGRSILQFADSASAETRSRTQSLLRREK